MEEFFSGPVVETLDKVGAVTAILLIAIAIITDKLVWHTRYKRALDRADRWEKVALEALASGAVAGVTAAEVAAAVVSALPDPVLDRKKREQETQT